MLSFVSQSASNSSCHGLCRRVGPSSWDVPRKGDTILRNGNGCNSDETSHKVSISSFYIGKYEVSQKEWKDIMGTVSGWANPSYFSTCGDNCPVERVNWYAA
ncbi:MAG: SUMF1/EgtB/PvdO family nonheme iron enzyme, partial [Saprospiraceae bacterium]|nr:SUMF1/EgtB/PvdO family nonheme iron enzyme [Saprospiraceae bacterium]